MSASDSDNYWRRLHQGRFGRRRMLAGGTTVLTHPLTPGRNPPYGARGGAGSPSRGLSGSNSAPAPRVGRGGAPTPALVQGYEVTAAGLQSTIHPRQGVLSPPPLSRP